MISADCFRFKRFLLFNKVMMVHLKVWQLSINPPVLSINPPVLMSTIWGII